MASCRTSFVKTSSTQIAVGQTKLISVHAVRTGVPSVATIKVFDVASSSDAGASNEVCRIVFDNTDPASPTMIEYDMHGVICSSGIYLEITGAAAVSVEFS